VAFRLRLTLAIGAALSAAGCSRPPPRPVVAITARATAKVELIDLVVSEPERAARLRGIYLEVVELRREVARARGGAARAPRLAGQGGAPVAGEHVGPEALERLLTPPFGEDRAALDRYARLMLEARRLLTEREFEQLNRLR